MWRAHLDKVGCRLRRLHKDLGLELSAQRGALAGFELEVGLRGGRDADAHGRVRVVLAEAGY